VIAAGMAEISRKSWCVIRKKGLYKHSVRTTLGNYFFNILLANRENYFLPTLTQLAGCARREGRRTLFFFWPQLFKSSG